MDRPAIVQVIGSTRCCMMRRKVTPMALVSAALEAGASAPVVCAKLVLAKTKTPTSSASSTRWNFGGNKTTHDAKPSLQSMPEKLWASAAAIQKGLIVRGREVPLPHMRPETTGRPGLFSIANLRTNSRKPHCLPWPRSVTGADLAVLPSGHRVGKRRVERRQPIRGRVRIEPEASLCHSSANRNVPVPRSMSQFPPAYGRSIV